MMPRNHCCQKTAAIPVSASWCSGNGEKKERILGSSFKRIKKRLISS